MLEERQGAKLELTNYFALTCKANCSLLAFVNTYLSVADRQQTNSYIMKRTWED